VEQQMESFRALGLPGNDFSGTDGKQKKARQRKNPPPGYKQFS
jgi:hypothetical protein